MTARILVVDDEPDLERLIQQKFRRQIHAGTVSFLFARDGVEALASLEANHDVDMVVTDINMPRMDGLSLLQKLQESEEQLSTIVVSAYGDMSNIRTAMNRGAFDFLTKPIDFRDLETTITKTIRQVEVLREVRRRQAQAERAYASLSRYFSPNLAERLASDRDAVDLGGQRREIVNGSAAEQLIVVSGEKAARPLADACLLTITPSRHHIVTEVTLGMSVPFKHKLFRHWLDTAQLSYR
jgi:adenylate cyclase